MGQIKYNISELMAAAFGYGSRQMPVIYTVSSETKSTSTIHYDLPVINSKEQAVELSKLGTPILFPVTFVGKGYNIFDQKGKIVQKNTEDFRLPASTIVELSREKAETTTALSGGTGSVKELYGFEDWKISLKGICYNETGHPTAPTTTEQKNKLYEWESLADSIKVESEILQEYNIYNLFIKSLNISQMAGKPEFMPFTLECYSDEPIELFDL